MQAKLEKIRALLETQGAPGILVERQSNFSWLTGGRGFIGLASEMACGGVLVTRDNAYLIAPNIEATRLVTEECPGLEAIPYPWTDEGMKETHLRRLAGEDVLRDSQLPDAFFALRTALTEAEHDAYRLHGPRAAAALEAAIRAARPGMTELALAGDISSQLWALGMEPITLLVAFDERIEKYRHPLPTGNPLERHLLAAICARVHGLIVSVTRCAYIGPLPDALQKRHEAVCRVDAALIRAARPDASLEALYDVAVQAYAREGFADEIALHHQGGLTGYMAREQKIAPGASHRVAAGEAYAFNPSITGVKAEDTILIHDTDNEIVTLTGAWPTLSIDGLQRPAILTI